MRGIRIQLFLALASAGSVWATPHVAATNASAAATTDASAGQTKKPPHLVMVLVDDNGWAGIGYNNPFLHTPVLDDLAAGGLKLTSHYVYK